MTRKQAAISADQNAFKHSCLGVAARALQGHADYVAATAAAAAAYAAWADRVYGWSRLGAWRHAGYAYERVLRDIKLQFAAGDESEDFLRDLRRIHDLGFRVRTRHSATLFQTALCISTQMHMCESMHSQR